jgi:hypothetical protein
MILTVSKSILRQARMTSKSRLITEVFSITKLGSGRKIHSNFLQLLLSKSCQQAKMRLLKNTYAQAPGAEEKQNEDH